MLIFLQCFDRRYTSQCCPTTTSEPHRLASLLCLLAQICTCRPHTGPRQCRRTKPLFQIASAWSNVVRGAVEGGTYCPLQSLPHSFEEQPSFITNRHTKRWAPKQYRTDPFMRTSAQHFGNHRATLHRCLSFSDTCTWVKDVEDTKGILNFPFLPVLWNRPILKLLFV